MNTRIDRTVRRSLSTAVIVCLVALDCAWAEVVRMEITQRAPFAEGHAFGSVGPYEKIVGRMYFAVRPDDPANAVITDIRRAPRNAQGQVEFWSDFFLLTPADPSRGNHRLLYDVNNRGNKLALWTFNDARGNDPTTLADAGNGFLMRHGYSVLWCGWNGDVVPGDNRLVMGLPIATENGQPITGKIHVEICRDEKVESQPLYWGPWGISAAYAPVSLDTSLAKLSMRATRAQSALAIPADRWAFARLEEGKPVVDPGSIWIKDGIQPGWLYDLVYEGKDPRVMGLGLAAVRDCASFFRYDAADRQKHRNPLAGAIERSYIFGISQSGRFVRHFLYDGFNTDLAQRIVFDGAFSHVPGSGRLTCNQRFGMMTLCAGHHENVLTPSEAFPFTTVPQEDPLTGQQGDLLARVRKSGHMPKIFITQTSTEYWTRGASLTHTDVEGKQDVPLDPSVRLYCVAGAQHLGAGPADRGNCQNPRNTLDDRGPVLRALLVALDRWASAGTPPPESRYPKLADGTLVDLEKFRQQFPRIPGVKLPKGYYTPLRLDFGPRYAREGIADVVPPRMGPAYRTLIPAVDKDGNEVAGIRLPEVAVPVATYTGWNLRAAAFGAEGMLAPYNGSYLAFARTADQRQRLADPRLSVRERYATRDEYLAKITQSAQELQRQGFLLEDDVTAIEKAAAARTLWDD